MGEGVNRKRDSIRHARFSHEAGDMHLHRTFFYAQGTANFSIGMTCNQQLQNFTLTLRECQWLFSDRRTRNESDPLNELTEQLWRRPY